MPGTTRLVLGPTYNHMKVIPERLSSGSQLFVSPCVSSFYMMGLFTTFSAGSKHLRNGEGHVLPRHLHLLHHADVQTRDPDAPGHGSRRDDRLAEGSGHQPLHQRNPLRESKLQLVGVAPPFSLKS